MKRTNLIAALALIAGSILCADAAIAQATKQRFVIEREIPGASRMSPDQLRDASAKSNGVLNRLGPDIQWIHSYVAGDKIYCIYEAVNEALIRRHAEISGFPANKITPVAAMIDPTTTH